MFSCKDGLMLTKLEWYILSYFKTKIQHVNEIDTFMTIFPNVVTWLLHKPNLVCTGSVNYIIYMLMIDLLVVNMGNGHQHNTSVNGCIVRSYSKYIGSYLTRHNKSSESDGYSNLSLQFGVGSVLRRKVILHLPWISFPSQSMMLMMMIVMMIINIIIIIMMMIIMIIIIIMIMIIRIEFTVDEYIKCSLKFSVILYIGTYLGICH